MTTAANGPGSPLIAGAAMSGADFHGEFNDISDDELVASNIFDFSNDPNTLQGLESLGASDHKALLSPQELNVGPFPDSPNGSYQDSSSESASSTKHTRRSTSSKTNTSVNNAAMDDCDVKMEWDNPSFGGFGDDDHTFTFGRDPVNTSGFDMFNFGEQNFGEHDDSFMDRSFDFESASSSPENPNGTQSNVKSPAMPAIKTNGLPKSDATPRKKRTQKHQKAPSQYSISSISGLKSSTSREASPMSNMVMSQDGSPAAMFSSPSPKTTFDFSKAAKGNMNGNTTWINKLDMPAPNHVDGLPTSAHLGGQIAHVVPMVPQLPLFTQPTYNFTGQCELRILPTPLKSRVETQIPIKMTLTPLPPGVTKLHLPAHTISKPKLLSKPTPDRSPDMLELFVTLVCTSAMEGPGMKQKALDRAATHSQGYLPPLDDEENSPQNGGDVRICQGCITRERKRAARKKIKKPEEEKVWSQDEERRVIVFNTQEVKEWQPLSGVMDPSGRLDPLVSNGAMQIDAPMRIACYCRHHGEKMGFNVIFTIKDFQDRVIAQAMSNPIMITDDHKTHPMTQLSTQQPTIPETANVPAMPMLATPVNQTPVDAAALLPHPPNASYMMSPSNEHSLLRNGQPVYQNSSSGKTTPTGTTPTVRSRPASPSGGGPPKKRKSSGSRIPKTLTMTPLDTSPSPSSQANNSQMNTATSPYAAGLAAFSQPEAMFGQQNVMTQFATGPPTPSSNDQPNFFAPNRSASMDNLAMTHLYSAPASNHPSRAPSPNGLRNNVTATQQNQFPQGLAGNLFALPMNMNQPQAPPTIHKIIPNEGPKMGGIEVTVLGAAFFQGLEVWFGDRKATTTTFWGESSLVCLLPPSPVAGAVAVTFKHQAAQASQAFSIAKQPPIFKYVDDDEDKIIRTALSVLGNKMSGQMMDVSDLARRILNDGNSNWGGGSSGGAPSSSNGQMFSHAPHAHLESQLLKCLDLIDLDDSTHRTRLDLKGHTGHTLLHLACSLGYHRFVAALLARGANPDARDKGGFTPLHMAAICNHSEIVRRLMLVGADPTIRSLSGLTAADVSQSRSVIRAIRRSERHVRSRSSGGSFHSRTSSATSLRSLWEPMTKVHSHEQPLSADSSEESPEYTSGDFEDEDPDENSYLSMRRSSGFRQDRERPVLRRQETDSLQEELERPTTALTAALKDHFQQQFQQFQQSMAMHFQNLPHLPQMPQMPQMPALPGMPVMPDYQAYLQQAPFMRRVQQLMPGIAGNRPDAGADEPERKDGNASPPPAYEDIFPQQELDRKMASAAQAACEAEADIKCANLYDQTQTSTTATVEASASTSASTSTEPKMQAPNVLMIGRKNAITKEQQEQFLRAREEKLKRLSSDRNLFFIWIPLLLVVMCAMVYSYFPSFFPFALALVRSLWQSGFAKTQQLLHDGLAPERLVQV